MVTLFLNPPFFLNKNAVCRKNTQPFYFLNNNFLVIYKYLCEHLFIIWLEVIGIFEYYQFSFLEKEVSDLYSTYGINTPSDLTIENISIALNINVYFRELSAKLIIDDKEVYIILDSRQPKRKQYEDFYHELAHLLLSHSTAVTLPLFHYFENRADNLIQYLAIPYNMLGFIDFKSDNLIEEVSTQFNVNYDLALKRIDNIKGKLEIKECLTSKKMKKQENIIFKFL